jgi:hypothetical protein
LFRKADLVRENTKCKLIHDLVWAKLQAEEDQKVDSCSL